MASKPSRTGTGMPKPIMEEMDNVPKPLAATLLQEFQNLKVQRASCAFNLPQPGIQNYRISEVLIMLSNVNVLP